MDLIKDPEFIKISALLAAFVVGVIVCVYVVVRESIELRRRRRAKQLMYNDAVRREVHRKKSEMKQAQQSNFQSFA